MCIAAVGRIVRITGEQTGPAATADVALDDGSRRVDLIMVPDAAVGDHIVVHAGLAVTVIPECEASATRQCLRPVSARRIDS